VCERDICSLLCGEKNVRERGWRGKCETKRVEREMCGRERVVLCCVERNDV